MRTRILVIVGPTASGKTAVAVALAKRLNAEIISADSIQIYKGLMIGSAKPTLEERQGIEHHLLDVIDISNATFSVAEYRARAANAINEIAAKGKLPIVAGGTGLYINALTYPLGFTSVAGDGAVREALNRQEEAKPGSVYAELQQIDPLRAAQLHPNDKKRIIRAMEIYRLSGQIPSSFGSDFSNAAAAEAPYDAGIFGLCMSRERLYARINARVDEMMEKGLLEEARSIHAAGYDPSLLALQGIGYKQLREYLRGDYSLQEAIDRIKMETRRYAKRQMTWFRRDARIHWYDIEKYDSIDMVAAAIAANWHMSTKGDR